MAKTAPITVTLPTDLIKDIDRIAREARISRSALVTEALGKRRWLWRIKKIQGTAARYAKAAGIASESDLERTLNR